MCELGGLFLFFKQLSDVPVTGNHPQINEHLKKNTLLQETAEEEGRMRARGGRKPVWGGVEVVSKPQRCSAVVLAPANHETDEAQDSIKQKKLHVHTRPLVSARRNDSSVFDQQRPCSRVLSDGVDALLSACCVDTLLPNGRKVGFWPGPSGGGLESAAVSEGSADSSSLLKSKILSESTQMWAGPRRPHRREHGRL